MADNGRIMRNTLFLALRMPIVLVAGLVTSRIVLQQLGTVDFGVYQVVAGFILLIAFINSSLVTSITRFINVEMVKSPDGNLQPVFAAACKCIVLAAGIFLVFAETAGLWLINNVLSIPPDRYQAAMAVYQLALITAIVEFFRIPYLAMQVAHERMSVYTYFTIFDCAMKLMVAIALFIIPSHRLEWYAVMLLGVALSLNVFLVCYTKSLFKGIRFAMNAPMQRVRQIGNFVGWTSLNSIAMIVNEQGGNIILNIFYGVTLNATMGIVNQVKSGITVLARNLLLASSPQMIKAFNAGQKDDFDMLFTRITRIVFYIILFFGLPVALNAQFILDVWLAEVPPYGAIFLIWVVVYCLINILAGPMDTAIYACGRLGWYQSCICAMSFVYIGALYFAYSLGAQPVWILITLVIVDVAIVCIRFYFISRYCSLPVSIYIRRSILPMIAVAMCGGILPTLLAFNMPVGAARFFATGTCSVLTMTLAILYLGFTAKERSKVYGKVRKIIHLK